MVASPSGSSVTSTVLDPGGSAWELDGGPNGSGTHLMFRHSGLGDAQPDLEFGSVNHTWGTILDALKAYPESGTPRSALG